jgi:hypothetical protein
MLNYNNIINIIITSNTNIDVLPVLMAPIPEDCTICYNEELEYIQYGCGHNMCAKCFSKFTDDRCHICRQKYQSIHRICHH